ncbi:MAG: transketolase [Planctomycetota bacterium]|nr:transketolase [Planctomycetota bacterium]
MTADHRNLHLMAQMLRRHSILMTSEAGSGHPTTCMSAAEIMSVLFFNEMRYDPAEPLADSTDRFVLSKGHAAPILWAALSEAGAISDDLLSLRKLGSPLEGHPMPSSPWVQVATGSLGQGLSAACGIALAQRMDETGSRVYCLLGDGECAEGSVWEAVQFAHKASLGNLCAIIDVNGLGQSGPTQHGRETDVYMRGFEAFGWKAIAVNGHSVAELLSALEAARAHTLGPTVIVALTTKGKGVSFVEGKEGWHGKPIKKGPDLDKALEELGKPDVSISVAARRASGSGRTDPIKERADAGDPQYELGDQVATRVAYGNALVRLGKVWPDVVVLDGDTKNSTFSEKFKDVFPDRFVEAHIAEQNMVGMALGLAVEGKIPFASSFACFLTRAYDFIRMAGYSQPDHLIICGSHAGVSIGEDGPSQMALEDIAMMRALLKSTVLYPSDAVSSERLVEEAAATPGITYIRTSRPKTTVLYPNTERFPVGGSKVLRSSEDDAVTVVGAGVTLHEALAAHDDLSVAGISIRVIDAYSIKPIDVETLRQAARDTRAIVTVEDHSVAGGLGEAVAAELSGLAQVHRLGVREIPSSATREELLDRHGISSGAIAAKVKEIVRGS